MLKDFGARVQYSVFEAILEADQLERLKERVREVVDLEEDTLRIYPLCGSCNAKVEVIGQGVVTEDPDVIVI